MSIVPNWRHAWKKFSLQALAAIGSLQGVLAVARPNWLAYHVPFLVDVTYSDFAGMLTFAVAVIGAIGSFIDQGLPTGTETP